MLKNQKFLTQDEKERRKGSDAGRKAFRLGFKRAIFWENDDRNIIYKNAYNEAYNKAEAAASSPEKTRPRAERAGKLHARNGTPKRDFTIAHETPEYIESYNKGYESIAPISMNVQRLKDERNGMVAGKKAGLNGHKKNDFSGGVVRSLEYIKAYNESYTKGLEKFLVSSSQEKQANLGKKAGQRAASKNSFKFGSKSKSATPAYQKAYLEAYDNYFLNKSKKSNQAGSALSYSVSETIQSLKGVSGTEESAPLGLQSGTNRIEGLEDEFNSKLYYPQQSLFLLPCFANSPTLGQKRNIDYAEILKPQQEPGTAINSVEGLGHYLDSLTSNSQTRNPLPTQVITTSLNLEVAGDLLGGYETPPNTTETVAIASKPKSSAVFFQYQCSDTTTREKAGSFYPFYYG